MTVGSNQLLSLGAPLTFRNPDFIDSLRSEGSSLMALPFWEPVSTVSAITYYKTTRIVGPTRSRKVTCIREPTVSVI